MSPPLSNGYDVRLLYLSYLEVAGSNPAGGLVPLFFSHFNNYHHWHTLQFVDTQRHYSNYMVVNIANVWGSQEC